MATAINRAKLKSLRLREEQQFLASHPNSAALYARAKNSLLGGVPMNWMKKWPGPFPVFVAHAKGAHFTDVDNHDYIDLCLGDTGAMTGHSPEIVAEAVAQRARQGITTMLPSEDALWVGEDLQKRFGLPFWQFTLTATDANRFAIRIAREITQRSKILVFNYCYHGTVDETIATLEKETVVPRRGNIGPPVNPAETTRIVEFNDLHAFEAALKHNDVACVLAEPAMTNVGIILPDQDYWPAARELCRRYGSLFLADETHTICAGPGGCTAEWQLDPDILVFGKAIGSGIPGATFGLSDEVAQRISARIQLELRRRRNRRHAGRQRAQSGGHARHPRAPPHAGVFRPDDSAGPQFQRRRSRRNKKTQPPVARNAIGSAGRIHIHAVHTPQWARIRSRQRLRTGTLSPPVHTEPQYPPHAIP